MFVRPRRAIAAISIVALTGCSLIVDTSGLADGSSSSKPDGGGLSDGNALGDGASFGGDGQANDGGATSQWLLSANGNTTCAVVGGQLLCWGANEHAQLGDGTKAQRNAPVAVTGLPAGVVSALGVGETHVCAIAGGDVICWGDGSSGQLGIGQRVDTSLPIKATVLAAGSATSVCAGSGFTCAVSNGDAYCWGINNRGQVGQQIGPLSDSPVKVGFADPTGPGKMAEVSCGQDHVCGRSATGDIWCWGHNDNGTLGSPTLDVGASAYKAVKVVGLPGPAEHLSMAGWHACVTIGGAAWCWGTGDNGELGNGAGQTSTQPVPVAGLDTGVTAIAAGGGADDGDATCAVQLGAVHCWGHGQRGRLGDGANQSRKTPYAMPSLATSATAIAAGYLHVCAVVGDTIRCWGAGDQGQLGDDGATDRATPVDVKLPAR